MNQGANRSMQLAGEYITIANSTNVGAGSFSVCMWINATLNGSENFFSQVGATWLSNNAGDLAAVVGGTSVTGPELAASGWQHVAAVYNGTNLTLYVNGFAGTPVAVTPGTLNTDFIVCGGGFTGYLRDIRIYSATVDPAVYFSMNAPDSILTQYDPNRDNMIAWFPGFSLP